MFTFDEIMHAVLSTAEEEAHAAGFPLVSVGYLLLGLVKEETTPRYLRDNVNYESMKRILPSITSMEKDMQEDPDYPSWSAELRRLMQMA